MGTRACLGLAERDGIRRFRHSYRIPLSPNTLPDVLLSRGQHSFTLEQAKELLSRDDAAARKGVERLARKGQVFSPARSLYVVVPPEFRTWGAVPGAHFIDDLMRFLERRYYVALLSAAELHGAAAQAPQIFQVMIDRQLRDRDFGRTRLRFYTGAHVAEAAVEQRNVPTGTIRVATREVTAVDLVEHPRAGGGIDNIATVLGELGSLDGDALAGASASRSRSLARRLGWLLSFVGADVNLDPLRQVAVTRDGNVTDLSAGGPRRGPRDRDWNVRVNVTVDPDL